METVGRLELYEHQKTAISHIRSGSIVHGGVGSGKTLISLVYYKKLFDRLKISGPLYVITTAKKRDSGDWGDESQMAGVDLEAVDSWNNIARYEGISDGYFIFDEQRAIGRGAWVKSFLKITKKNHWILLTATPGDNWLDYIPVFIANGFYKNRSEFLDRHAVYTRFSRFPKVTRFLEEGHLQKLRDSILVRVDYISKKEVIDTYVPVEYDKQAYKKVFRERFNHDLKRPIRGPGELFYIARRVVNSDPSRLSVIRAILHHHRRIIVFYNYNYELEILRNLCEEELPDFKVGERNGHKHDDLPDCTNWVYLVQYSSGAESWNCVSANTIVFFSPSYSYKTMVQSAGRIDRINSPFPTLYYYRLTSPAPIDLAITRALKQKKDFNANAYMSREKPRV